ncbi:hypothetical protein OIU77_006337, partial [Salix suchowensis]
MFSPKNQTH